MDAQILHSGFDGLRFTIQTEITPELRKELALAKAHAKEFGHDIDLHFGDVHLSVTQGGGRTFNTHTGELGAVWMFQDPEDRIPNNPGITVDFRAFGLATGGLDQAERHFRDVMDALKVPYGEHQLRVSRVDFAVDILAPWFEPDRLALVAPPGTKVTEYTGVDETVTQATAGRVTGLRAHTQPSYLCQQRGQNARTGSPDIRPVCDARRNIRRAAGRILCVYGSAHGSAAA